MTDTATGEGAVARARRVVTETGRPVFISTVPGGPADGIPFVVKDNIDVVGTPTTVGCPSLGTPAETSATAVQRLEQAGYAVVGKTNLDQFATGLVGTRSPYGACSSVADPTRISGGSSSGSAVAVARGIVPLALGTDTAGSGRVPAALNGVIGMKPTRGLVSAHGVFPACRSLDCVTTFTRSVADARAALTVLAGPDPMDPLSRSAPAVRAPGLAATFTTLGVPSLPPGLDPAYDVAFARSLDRARTLGFRLVPVVLQPFLDAGALLYGGAWVAERFAAFGHLLDGPGVDPTVRSIVEPGGALLAANAFAGFDALASLRSRTLPVWEDIDALLLPTVPRHPRLTEVAADPAGVNAELGTFTTFANLLDLCAVAVPGEDTADGLPFGVQFLGPAFTDNQLLDLTETWTGESSPEAPMPAAGSAHVVLVGAHMSGLPLNHLVAGRGGQLARRATVADGYDLVRVPGPGVPRPALVTGTAGGFAVEVWEVPLHLLGQLATELGPPLRFGQVRLHDGSRVLGFVGDESALGAAQSLGGHAGWRDYLRNA